MRGAGVVAGVVAGVASGLLLAAAPAAAPAAAQPAAVAPASRPLPPKVEHAEPLYIDLIRDLGARRGEAEWNVGLGLTDRLAFDEYTVLVEYEWAVRDRLGLEIELPATIYSAPRREGATASGPTPASRLESLKTAVQWTTHVSERRQTSFALGYINELRVTDPRGWNGRRAVAGNGYNPFFVAAKRWTHHAHTLVYAGATLDQTFGRGFGAPAYEINSSAHYLLPGTRNFVGLEVNQVVAGRRLDTVLRPQMRLAVAGNLLLGVVVGVPVHRREERLSTFFRVIYEPRQHRGAVGH